VCSWLARYSRGSQAKEKTAECRRKLLEKRGRIK
jgi:hypothetical protein